MGMNLTYTLNYEGKDYKFRAINLEDLLALKKVNLVDLEDGKEDFSEEAIETAIKFFNFITSLYIGEDKQDFVKWKVSDSFGILQKFMPFMTAKLMGSFIQLGEIDIKEIDTKKKKITQ